MPSARPAPTPENTLQRPRRAVSSGWASLDQALFAGALLPRGADLNLPGLGPAGPDDAPSAGSLKRGAPSGLVRGGVHEWFGTGAHQEAHAGEAWAPPQFLLGHLAARAVQEASERGAPTHVLWIGRSVWPYPRTLNGGVDLAEVDRLPSSQRNSLSSFLMGFDLELREVPERFSLAGGALFEHSLFVDPGSGAAQTGQRLWAIDTALRCPSVTAIVADGSGLPMAGTRRLQLAAAAADALVLLARPPAEVGEISAATTRWTVTRIQDEDTGATDFANGAEAPRWRVELLRAKGSQGIR